METATREREQKQRVAAEVNELRKSEDSHLHDCSTQHSTTNHFKGIQKLFKENTHIYMHAHASPAKGKESKKGRVWVKVKMGFWSYTENPSKLRGWQNEWMSAHTHAYTNATITLREKKVMKNINTHHAADTHSAYRQRLFAKYMRLHSIH